MDTMTISILLTNDIDSDSIFLLTILQVEIDQ